MINFDHLNGVDKCFFSFVEDDDAQKKHYQGYYCGIANAPGAEFASSQKTVAESLDDAGHGVEFDDMFVFCRCGA